MVLRSLGLAAAPIDRVRAELDTLREGKRALRRLVQFDKQARRTLRGIKKRASEPLQQQGYYYHGDTIHKRRRKQTVGE